MDLLQRTENIIAPSLESHGYDVVRIRLSGIKRPVLQIMIERLDGVSITVDDCAIVSRVVSVLLDQHDPIKGHYILEVSSPGLDRPLVKAKDFQRFCGNKITFKTRMPIEGRKNFKGYLESASEKEITVLLDVDSTGENVQIVVPLEDILSAKLDSEFSGNSEN